MDIKGSYVGGNVSNSTMNAPGKVMVGGTVTNSIVNGKQSGDAPTPPAPDRVTLGGEPHQSEVSWKNLWGLFGGGTPSQGRVETNATGGVIVRGNLTGQNITVGGGAAELQ